jgi:hypothetical protein
MAGTIKTMLDRIVTVRGRGEHVFIEGTRTKLILMGLNPDKYTSASPDDPAVMAKVRRAAADLGVTL